MKEVYKNLFVGSQVDFESNMKMFDDWYVVHACKEPYHRQALGYTGRAAPKESPHYLFLYNDKNHLILNMVDTDSPVFFRDEMINEAIVYIIKGLVNGKHVLIHCNQGESRAPSLALLALRKMGVFKGTFSESIILFRNSYPGYNPKSGIYNYIRIHW